MKFARIRAGVAGIVLATGLTVAMTALPATAAPTAPAAVAQSAVTAPVTGTFTDASGGTGTLTGTYTPTQFAADGQQLLSQGTLTGTLVDSAGQPVGTTTQAVTLPVGSPDAIGIQATCQVLNLVLGPLDLNLLGLVVHLDTVHLNITAQPGPGNLVGNLLCALTGLLDPLGDLAQIVALLNAILGLLG